jgi:flagellar biosynthesis/type III secretory pathway protein FliH
VVETGAGSLEARLELQLEGLKDTLLKAHRGNGEAR